MPYDGNGNFSLVAGYFVQDGDDVLPSQHNPPFEDVASGLSQVVVRSGAAPMGGNLNMNGNKVTGLAAPTNPNDALRLADLTARPRFMAHKNGAGQAVTMVEKITFGTTEFNDGAYYDTTNSRFTPPAGKYRLSASYTVQLSTGNRSLVIELRKNGTLIKRSRGYADGLNQVQPQISVPVEANGTDYFEIWYGTTDPFTVIGDAADTWFCGEAA